MAERNTGPTNYSDLPILPTGSGVADLEVAYEQMRLVEDAEMSPLGEVEDRSASTQP